MGPEKKFSAGSISATIWTNKKEINGSAVELHSISLQRSYKDAEGNWQNVSSLRTNDLPKAKLVLDKAYEYLAMSGQSA